MRLTAFAFACLFAPGSAMAASSAPRLSADECVVWQREQSFARSVANHDAAAFAGHVGQNAAFGASSPEPTRGREAIVKRWAGLIEGKRALLRWYPTRVTMAPDVMDIAWSSGPALFEVLDPEAKDRYLLGAFHSVWHKDTDGVWRVLFDDGVEPRPATPGEVDAFNSGQADCSS
jgi:ketosteroid isomerase-like protein